jgi:alkylation response protein AidB-like acyl-CoA dehydrogenase
MRKCIPIVLAILLTGSWAWAETTDLQSPEHCLTYLQAQQAEGHDAFVVQSELDPIIRQGGGGACATAAAIDAIQTLRVMAGHEPLANPHRAVLKAIDHQEELLNGRVTDAQLHAAITEAASHHLPDLDLSIRVHPSPHGPFAAKGDPWPAETGPDLDTANGELKIVTYTVTTREGVTLGRHFVLVKALDGDTLVVVDPAKPGKDRTYSLVGRDVPKYGRRMVLLPPAKFRSEDTFEVHSVFCLHLKKRSTAGQAPATIRELQGKIDETAALLRETGAIRSPRAWRRATASYGLPGLDLPKELGGSEWSTLKTLEAFIHASRHDLNCRDVVGGAHVRPLLHSTAPEVQDIVRQVATGKAYMAITMTEPTAGSDFHAIKSTAKKVDGGYVLTGEKRYVARLGQATHVIVFTQPASGARKGLSAFVLDINTPGLERYTIEAHGLKGNSFGGMRFKDVPVADWQLIGADGEGDKIFEEHFRYWRLMQVGAAIGTAERALEQMAERLVNREAYGGPIGRFSHLQQALGQHTTELLMAKALAREAAELLDRGEGKQADAIINGLKAEGVEIALAAVDSAMRAYGAEGYSDRVDLGDRLHDLQGLRIADGTTDVMRMSVVAKSFGETGKRLWKMAVRGED